MIHKRGIATVCIVLLVTVMMTFTLAMSPESEATKQESVSSSSSVQFTTGEGETDTEFYDPYKCNDGETKECGFGEEAGILECENGQWSACKAGLDQDTHATEQKESQEQETSKPSLWQKIIAFFFG